MEQKTDIIAGRNAVSEALRAGRPIDRLCVKRGERTGNLGALCRRAESAGIPVKETDPRKLDEMAGGLPHQGVVAVAAAHRFAEPEEIFRLAKSRGEAPFVIVCDGLEDPHNLGAVIRTAECVGAHGVVVPKRGASGLTATVAKASAGAVEYVPVARVANLAAFLEELKARNVWVYAADMDGEPYHTVDFSGGAALIVGAEGAGVSRLLKERADKLVSLPMQGRIQSLNASVACGVLCYEIARQRGFGAGNGRRGENITE